MYARRSGTGCAASWYVRCVYRAERGDDKRASSRAGCERSATARTLSISIAVRNQRKVLMRCMRRNIFFTSFVDRAQQNNCAAITPLSRSRARREVPYLARTAGKRLEWRANELIALRRSCSRSCGLCRHPARFWQYFYRRNRAVAESPSVPDVLAVHSTIAIAGCRDVGNIALMKSIGVVSCGRRCGAGLAVFDPCAASEVVATGDIRPPPAR